MDHDGSIGWVDALMQQTNEDELAIGAALPAEMIFFSGIQVLNDLRKNILQIYKAPQFFLLKAGEKNIKLAIVGISWRDGSPVIVSEPVSNILYERKNSIQEMCRTSYRDLTASQKTIDALQGSKNVILI